MSPQKSNIHSTLVSFCGEHRVATLGTTMKRTLVMVLESDPIVWIDFRYDIICLWILLTIHVRSSL